MSHEYIIYADESAKKGISYSNFYGGALIRSADLMATEAALNLRKKALGFLGEVKWRKVTAQYLDRYLKLMALFMDLIEADKVKIRIMFTQNRHRAVGLSSEQIDNVYFLLYYQFVKHAFGLAYSNQTGERITCRLYFDQFPHTAEKVKAFRGYLCGLSKSSEFHRARIEVHDDAIAEVRSHDHVILQCLDVVLGAMQFRLNEGHRLIDPQTRRRGKKTRAKEQLYKFILSRVGRIYPHFNIGISTGTQGDPANRWRHSYRHWLFVPKQHTRE